jgi:hypothetical protein
MQRMAQQVAADSLFILGSPVGGGAVGDMACCVLQAMDNEDTSNIVVADDLRACLRFIPRAGTR